MRLSTFNLTSSEYKTYSQDTLNQFSNVSFDALHPDFVTANGACGAKIYKSGVYYINRIGKDGFTVVVNTNTKSITFELFDDQITQSMIDEVSNLVIQASERAKEANDDNYDSPLFI